MTVSRRAVVGGMVSSPGGAVAGGADIGIDDVGLGLCTKEEGLTTWREIQTSRHVGPVRMQIAGGTQQCGRRRRLGRNEGVRCCDHGYW